MLSLQTDQEEREAKEQERNSLDRAYELFFSYFGDFVRENRGQLITMTPPKIGTFIKRRLKRINKEDLFLEDYKVLGLALNKLSQTGVIELIDRQHNAGELYEFRKVAENFPSQGPGTLLLPINNLVFPSQTQREHLYSLQLSELAASIKARGQLEPILVRLFQGSTYQVIDGVRRVLAIDVLGWDRVLAKVIRNEVDDKQAFILRYSRNASQASLSELERATWIKNAYEASKLFKSVPEISKSLGLPPGIVRQYLTFFSIPSELQSKVKNGSWSISKAVKVANNLSIASDEELNDYLHALEENRLNHTEALLLARKIYAEKKRGQPVDIPTSCHEIIALNYKSRIGKEIESYGILVANPSSPSFTCACGKRYQFYPDKGLIFLNIKNEQNVCISDI